MSRRQDGVNDRQTLAAVRSGWWERRIAPRLTPDPSGCLLWTGYMHQGYGRAGLPHAVTGARHIIVGVHRASLIRELDREMPGMVADHTCRVHNCVYVGHLREVTNGENVSGYTSFSQSALHRRRDLCSVCETPLSQGKNQRYCKTCVDGYHAEQRRTIHEARGHLGLSFRGYVKEYGQSIYVARSIIEGAQ